MPIPRQVHVNVINMKTLETGSGIRLMHTPLRDDRHKIVISITLFRFGRQEMTKLRNEKIDWDAMSVKITLSSIVPRQMSGV